MIYMEPCAGLGNRMLAIATAYKIASSLNKELVLLWDIDGTVGAEIQELFTLPSNIKIVMMTKLPYKKKFLLRCKSSVIRLFCKLCANKSLDCEDIINYRKNGQLEIVSQLIRQYKKVYVKSYCELSEIEDIDFFEIFKPSENILAFGKNIFEKINNKTIGIHIRRTDHIEAIENSPNYLFIEIMHDLLKKGLAEKFFLATDDKCVEQKLVDKFGDIIIYNNNKNFKRTDKEGMIDGVIDLVALSKCTCIYGSYGSTFSKVASYINNIELKIVSKDNYKINNMRKI